MYLKKPKTSCSIKSFIIFLIYNWSLGRKKNVHGKQKNYVSTCTVYLAISSYLLSSPAGSWSDWWHWWPESLGHWLGVGGDKTTWLCKFLHPPVVTKIYHYVFNTVAIRFFIWCHNGSSTKRQSGSFTRSWP